MKIFANNKAYVQNNDLAYLMRGAEGISIPASIFEKVFGKVFIVTDQNRYDFVEFSEPKEIEFFKECDWMVDYNMFDGMTEEQIIEYGCKITDERNKMASEFNSLSQVEREKQYMRVSNKLELLDFKMWSVMDVLWHKQGRLKFSLPKGTDASYIESKDKKDNVFNRVLKRIRKK